MTQGIHVQKNDLTAEAAEAFRDDLLLRATQEKTFREVSAHLPEAWLKQAEAAYDRFGKTADGLAVEIDLMAAVDGFLATNSRKVTSVAAAPAVDGYIKQRLGRGNQQTTCDVCEAKRVSSPETDAVGSAE